MKSIVSLLVALVVIAVSLVVVDATYGHHHYPHPHHHYCHACPPHKELNCGYGNWTKYLVHSHHKHHHRHRVYCRCNPRTSCEDVVCPHSQQCVLNSKGEARCVYAMFCNQTTCHADEVCREYTSPSGSSRKARCHSARTCDQIDCPTGFECVEKRSRHSGSSKAHCVVSCAGVTCPPHHKCRSEYNRAVCVPRSSCDGVSCPGNSTCTKYTHSRVQCVAKSCDSASCPDSAKCLKFVKTKKVWHYGHWYKVPIKKWASCAYGCTATTCPTRQICHQYRTHRLKGKESTISCLPARCCSQITCPEGQRCAQQYVNHKPVAVCVDDDEGSGSASAIPPPPPMLPPPPETDDETEA